MASTMLTLGAEPCGNLREVNKTKARFYLCFVVAKLRFGPAVSQEAIHCRELNQCLLQVHAREVHGMHSWS